MKIMIRIFCATLLLLLLPTSRVFAETGSATTGNVSVVTRTVGLTLSSLIPGSGTLSPTFTSATLTYTVNAGTSSSITLTPTSTDAAATMTLNGVLVASGSASAAIPLASGSNSITTVVSAPNSASTQTYTVTVTRVAALLEQTISFGVLAAKTYGDAPFAVSATASSGLVVTFLIISGPATILGNTITLTGAGTVTVRASQAGNSNYAAASSVDRSFSVITASVVSLADWAASAGLSQANAAPTATPFNDGISNFLKYAFNMNAGGPDTRVLANGGTAGLPQVVMDPSGALPVLRVTFLHRKSSGLVYTPQRSTTLGSFEAMTGTPTVTSIDTQWEQVSVSESLSLSTTPKAFARVQVIQP